MECGIHSLSQKEVPTSDTSEGRCLFRIGFDGEAFSHEVAQSLQATEERNSQPNRETAIDASEVQISFTGAGVSTIMKYLFQTAQS
jgi:hypothetical protein